ncbi:MAG: hypothetical protein JXA20_04115 [Spirochaetes bacterium]|nr:hypothetical protein [Spirochaetota bacterium]
MGVTSVRFNQKEEKLIKFLKEYYNCDASTLVKKSLWDLYEDIKDREEIEAFEKKEKSGKVKFVSFENLK